MMNLLIAADLAPQNRVAKLIECGNYQDVFAEVKPIISSADYSIVNLEAPIVYDDADPISKTGPNIKSHVNTIDAITYAGFKCVTLANNHFYDYGDTGVKNTIDRCVDNKIDFVGGGLNIHDAEKVLYKDICDKRVAIINVCENEWSIATKSHGGSAPLNIVDNCRKIKDAKSKSDFLIIIVHGGTEHYQLPTPRMKATYRFFVENGADVVVNHHQHCYSGYEVYDGKPIFYGLGNFCFDKNKKISQLWNTGYMVLLKLKDSGIDYELIPYTQCAEKPNIDLITNTETFYKDIYRLNGIIANDDELEQSFNEMIKKKKSYLTFFEPFTGRLVNFLRYHKLFPRFLSKSQKKLLLELFRCESHRDIILRLLKGE